MNVGRNASRSSSSFPDRGERMKRLKATDKQKVGRPKQRQTINSQNGRKMQIQTINQSLSSSGELRSLFPSPADTLPTVNGADRAALALLERDPLLCRASGGFRLFVRNFTDRQLLKCLRTPTLNTLDQWAPPNLRYIHVLRSAWKKLTQFERFDWQELFERYAEDGHNSTLGISMDDNSQLLEDMSSDKLEEQRLCQFQWVSTVDSDHLPCPLCSFGNPRRYDIGQLLTHLSLSHHSAHLFACHCCSMAFSGVEALKEHGTNLQCRPFLRYMHENARQMGDDKLIFDFAYASLICAECGLHVLLSPRCDQDKLADTLLNLILSHSNQSLALCLTYASVELAQPSVKIGFLRPVIVEPVTKCEFCLRSGWNSPMDLERHCAMEHKSWAINNQCILQCPECSAKFYTAPLFCDHLLSKHLRSNVPMVTQLLRTIPQFPPALDKNGTVLLGTVGIDRFPSPSSIYATNGMPTNPLKWVPAAERAAREGELRRSKRKRKRRRLHTPAPEDEEAADEDEEGEEEDDSDVDWDENETSRKGRPSGGLTISTLFQQQNFSRWKTKMRLLEAQALSSTDGPLAEFVEQLELPVQLSGDDLIVQNTLDGALLTDSVYKCSKCNAIIFGDCSITDHIVECYQIERTDGPDFQLMLDEYVFDNVEVLFMAGNFPFTRIRCDLCQNDCCSVVSLRRHYAQCHGILCAFQSNKSTVRECAAVLLRRNWANTGFDRELFQQINSSQPPHCTSEFESECAGNAILDQLGPVEINVKTLYSSLAHAVDSNGGEPKSYCENPMENEEQWEAEKSASSLDKTSDGDVSMFSNVVVKEELNEEMDEDESGGAASCILNKSNGTEFGDNSDEEEEEGDNHSSSPSSSAAPLVIKNELSSPCSSPASTATFADFLNQPTNDIITNENNNINNSDEEEDEEETTDGNDDDDDHDNDGDQTVGQLVIDQRDDSDQQQTEQNDVAPEQQQSPLKKRGNLKKAKLGTQKEDGQDEKQTKEEISDFGHDQQNDGVVGDGGVGGDNQSSLLSSMANANTLRRSLRKRKKRDNGSAIVHYAEDGDEEEAKEDETVNDQENLADHRDEANFVVPKRSPKKYKRKRGRPKKLETIIRSMKMEKKSKGQKGAKQTLKKGRRKMKTKGEEDEEWLRPKRPYMRRKPKVALVADGEKHQFIADCEEKKTDKDGIYCPNAVPIVEVEEAGTGVGDELLKPNDDEVEAIMKGMERHFHRKKGRSKRKDSLMMASPPSAAITTAADQQHHQSQPKQQQPSGGGPSTSYTTAHTVVSVCSSTFVCFMCTAVEKDFDAFGLHLRTHPEQWKRCTVCPQNDTNKKTEDQPTEEDQLQQQKEENKPRKRRNFDHPVHFLQHLIEFHMNFQQKDRVQCPWCVYFIQFSLANQRYRASAAMFRHMVYECVHSGVCLLCGFMCSTPSSPPLPVVTLSSNERDTSTNCHETNDQLVKHRLEKHNLIFDRFICFSCKGGFYSREQFLHHTCDLALRCVCNPYFRFLSRDSYGQHLLQNKSNLKKHGLLQAENEVDLAKRKCMLNEEYRRHVAMLGVRWREEEIERETAKAVAEIKKKVADLNNEPRLTMSNFGSPNSQSSTPKRSNSMANEENNLGVFNENDKVSTSSASNFKKQQKRQNQKCERSAQLEEPKTPPLPSPPKLVRINSPIERSEKQHAVVPPLYAPPLLEENDKVSTPSVAAATAASRRLVPVVIVQQQQNEQQRQHNLGVFNENDKVSTSSYRSFVKNCVEFGPFRWRCSPRY